MSKCSRDLRFSYHYRYTCHGAASPEAAYYTWNSKLTKESYRRCPSHSSTGSRSRALTVYQIQGDHLKVPHEKDRITLPSCRLQVQLTDRSSPNHSSDDSYRYNVRALALAFVYCTSLSSSECTELPALSSSEKG